MSKLYKNQDEYLPDLSTLPASIESVDTAIPAFIGYTSKAQQLEIGDLLMTPTKINSLQDYEKYFGKKVNESIQVFIKDELLKTGETSSLQQRRIEIRVPYLRNNFYYHLQAYFSNGGGPCYVVSVGKPRQSPGKRDLKKGLDEVYQYAEPTLICFPDGVHLPRAADLYQLYNEALAHASELGDRFVIMDINENELQGKSPVTLFREQVGSSPEHADLLKYGAAYYPSLETTIPLHYADGSARVTHEIITREAGEADRIGKGDLDLLYLNNPRILDTPLYTAIKNEIANCSIRLAPSSIVAAIYATLDRESGVWKAPANIALKDVKAPAVSLNDQEQSGLNVDPLTGKSINAIRYFAGKGTMIWGARTLAGNDHEWRYIPVRRFFNMVERSIKKATAAFAYEPNDTSTWLRLQSLIENYLVTLWRKGALTGAKPEHAFFVKIGPGQSMTNQDIIDGRLVIEIGMAPVKPAEFIITRIVQIMQTN